MGDDNENEQKKEKKKNNRHTHGLFNEALCTLPARA